jgi:AcrR family transcriptional regulator
MKNSSASTDDTRPYHHGDLRRALISTGMAMIQEQNDWTFSLREVARRAGVSHNAPYNHFADKHDLLAALATAGFEMHREKILAAISGAKSAEAALIKAGVMYVKFGVENPALYRLMFGSIFAPSNKERPESLADAAANAKKVLAEILQRGAREGVFTVSPTNQKDFDITVLTAWSTVHGLTMLAIDERIKPPTLHLGIDKIAEKVLKVMSGRLMQKG